MERIESGGRWWLPESEDRSVAGTLTVSQGGAVRLSLLGVLGEAKDIFDDKRHPIILGHMDEGPRGHDVTLRDTFRTGATYGSFKDARETYHVGRAYFGALLPEESSFAFRSMRLRLGGLTEWLHILSGFEGPSADLGSLGSRIPLIHYTRHAPTVAAVPGGSVTAGLGLRAKYSRTSASFHEEGQVQVTCDNPLSESDLNTQYGHPLRCLMTFACDRAQAIERFSVWRPDAPDHEVIVVGELVQPEGSPCQNPSWREMLFTIGDLGFADFVPKWLTFTRQYQDACTVYFGMMYGPPAYLDIKFQNLVNAAHLYFERHPDGEARRQEDLNHLKAVRSHLPGCERAWLYDHIGASPRPPLRQSLEALLEWHGNSIDPLITGLRDRFVDSVLETMEYVERRERQMESSAAFGANLHWLTEKLRFLIKACFLHEAGFTPGQVDSLFARNALFQHIRLQESGLGSPSLTSIRRRPSHPDSGASDRKQATESGTFEAAWQYLGTLSDSHRIAGITAYLDESLAQALGDRDGSFSSKISMSQQRGLLTESEHHDLLEIGEFRDRAAHSAESPKIDDVSSLIGRLWTWRGAVGAMPDIEETLNDPSDRLRYVASVILARLEHRRSAGGKMTSSETEHAGSQTWPRVIE